jgi:multidrug efflux pump subunit AcrA (membrane-fusion protein)
MSALIDPVRRSAAALLVGLSLAGCGGATEGQGPGGPPGGGMPAMGVEVVTLAERPVETVTEYIGTVKSRRSTTIQPQVEGFLTRIVARSGDRVRQGAVLMEVDAGRQEATVANLEAQRGAREADLVYWKQQSDRLRALLEAGAVSQQEYDQAAATLRTGTPSVSDGACCTGIWR